MGQVCLISGPPGCGKTTWVLQRLQQHQGPCAYLRLEGDKEAGLEQGADSGIDLAWLKDQVPRLDESTPSNAAELKQDNDGLTLIEVQQFHPPSQEGIEGLENEVRSKLEALQLQPDQFLHFGRDPELPAKDTLEFSKLEAWHTSLSGFVWDPNSLSSFWFELVNGAYGDVYRAKGLMNLPDGRAFFCNWMVSQESSQFLPLNTTASPLGRPNRTSELVVQGKALNPEGIQATINDCLLADDVLAMQQQQLQQQQPTSQG
jgi:G3E family GTPase